MSKENAREKAAMKDNIYRAGEKYASKGPSNDERRSRFAKYGLCRDCENFSFASSEFDIRFCRCTALRLFLSGNEPITECTSYWQRGSMSLYDMMSQAIILDLSENAPPGFIK
ncbi:MAG: hypothetical protein V3V00_10445 [Saprospiraceae bacterium]